MKKLLSFVLALVVGIGCMATLAGCKDNPNKNGSNNDAAIVEKAITMINTMYRDKAEETPQDYTVTGEVKVDGTNYSVTWTTNTANAVVGTMNTTTKAVPITITRTDADIPYTLTASVTVGKESDSITFNRKIPAGVVGGDVVYDFSSVTEKGTSLNGASALALLNGLTTTAELTNVTVSSFYAGNGSGGGSYENSGGLLKVGTGSANGSMTLTFAKQVKKIVVEAEAWPKDTTTLTVNDGEAQTITEGAKLTYTYEFESTNVVKLDFVKRAFIFQIIVYYDKDAHNHVYSYTHKDGTMQHTATCTADGCDLTAPVVEDCTAENNVCRFCKQEYSETQILDALFALEAGKSLKGTYELTGAITSIKEIQNGPTYYNTTFNIQVGDKETYGEITVYRAVGDDYETIEVGFTVTVVGELTNYNGTYEFTQGCVITKIETPDIGDHVHNWTTTHNEGEWTHTAHCSNSGCNYPEGAKTEDCTPVLNECSACGHEYSESDILTALFALTSNASLKGTYQLRGKVTEIVTAYDPGYGNITFNMQVGDKIVQAYRGKGEGAENIMVGDTVTVSGTLKRYSSTYEFDSGCAITNIVEASPADKVANALAAVPSTLTNVTAIGNVTLPVSTVAGVTFTWVSDNDTYTVADGKLVVDALPSSDVTVTLTVTANCTGVTSNNTKTVTVIIKAAGTPELKSGSMSFANADARDHWNTNEQVWISEGITLTNAKDKSTTNVADYSNPARFYASSKITIEFEGINTIVFNANSASYATALQTSINNANISGATVSVNSKVVTVTFASPVNVIEFSCSGQIRLDSLTINK